MRLFTRLLIAMLAMLLISIFAFVMARYALPLVYVAHGFSYMQGYRAFPSLDEQHVMHQLRIWRVIGAGTVPLLALIERPRPFAWALAACSALLLVLQYVSVIPEPW
jgi:hypothetical protein